LEPGDGEPTLKFKIRVDEPITFRGVLSGKPYPLFWIDVHEENMLYKEEDILFGKRDETRDKTKEIMGRGFPKMSHKFGYSDEYIKANKNASLFIPFIVTENEDGNFERPTDLHKKEITQLQKYYSEFKTQNQQADNVSDDTEPISTELKEELREKIRSRLEELSNRNDEDSKDS
jgi:hypothetical protein